MEPILPVVPSHRRSEMLYIHINAVVSTKPLLVARENDTVLSGYVHADTVVGIGLSRMQVENEEASCAFKNDNLVTLMFKRNIRLFGELSARRASNYDVYENT